MTVADLNGTTQFRERSLTNVFCRRGIAGAHARWIKFYDDDRGFELTGAPLGREFFDKGRVVALVARSTSHVSNAGPVREHEALRPTPNHTRPKLRSRVHRLYVEYSLCVLSFKAVLHYLISLEVAMLRVQDGVVKEVPAFRLICGNPAECRRNELEVGHLFHEECSLGNSETDVG